jgi:phosphorylcholine metabolism protein LicD
LTSEIFPADYFKETAYLDFRDRTFPAIKNYENYLSNLYGNWKEELPLDKQRSNHEITVWYKDE